MTLNAVYTSVMVLLLLILIEFASPNLRRHGVTSELCWTIKPLASFGGTYCVEAVKR